MLRSLHIDVIVARPARIKGGWDGAEVIATFGVRKDVSAIAVATIVVFAVLVGMPQIYEGSFHRTARALDASALPRIWRRDAWVRMLSFLGCGTY